MVVDGSPSPELILGRFGHGWLRDVARPEDYSRDHPDVAALIASLGLDDASPMPTSVDLRQWTGPVRSQGGVNACTAFATCAAVEYLERRAFDKIVPQSPRFLFKVTSNLLMHDSTHGAHTRSALGALATFGTVPEAYWPWDETSVDVEPSAFCYALARSRRAVSYIRLDHPNVIEPDVIRQARELLVAGLPLIAGFSLFGGPIQASIASMGEIALPTEDDQKLGGHAVLIVGYDDERVVRSTADDSLTTKGAFLFQNSWTTAWGEAGFGWLPYAYVEIGQCVDWWALLGEHWVATDRFGF